MSSYVNDNETIDDMNAWNRTRRYGAAYLDNENDPTLTMDVVLDQKVSRAYLRAVMKQWRDASMKFDRYVRR